MCFDICATRTILNCHVPNGQSDTVPDIYGTYGNQGFDVQCVFKLFLQQKRKKRTTDNQKPRHQYLLNVAKCLISQRLG